MVYPTAIVGGGRHYQRKVDGLGIPVFAQMFTEMSVGKVDFLARRRSSSTSAISSRAIGTPCLAPSRAPSFAIKRYYATVNGRVVIDRLLPQNADRRRFDSQSVRGEVYPDPVPLITSGVPLLEATEHLRQDVGATSDRRSIDECAGVSAEENHFRAAGQVQRISQNGARMIAVGSPPAPSMPCSARSPISSEVDQAVTLTSLLEPIMMVVFSSIVVAVPADLHDGAGHPITTLHTPRPDFRRAARSDERAVRRTSIRVTRPVSSTRSSPSTDAESPGAR